MIVLDTNVLSEVMRNKPDTKVIGWLNGQASDDLFLTAISLPHGLPPGSAASFCSTRPYTL